MPTGWKNTISKRWVKDTRAEGGVHPACLRTPSLRSPQLGNKIKFYLIFSLSTFCLCLLLPNFCKGECDVSIYHYVKREI